jgi:hypothetical protein
VQNKVIQIDPSGYKNRATLDSALNGEYAAESDGGRERERKRERERERERESERERERESERVGAVEKITMMNQKKARLVLYT